jgi:protein-S-isoprenylcysteine O-methyltransferase Ste14
MRSVPYHLWYGNWEAALFSTAFFGLFFLGCLFPRRPREWGSLGAFGAFLFSFFAEMFGFPLTLYLLAPLLGERLGAFGLFESHLWAYLAARTGLVSQEDAFWIIMNITLFTVGAACVLVVLGWLALYEAGGRLATGGVYRLVRHPQYLGLMMLVAAFLIQWPTLPTLLLAPVLLRLYHELALAEERDLARACGEEWRRYAERVPRFLPWPRLARKSL